MLLVILTITGTMTDAKKNIVVEMYKLTGYYFDVFKNISLCFYVFVVNILSTLHFYCIEDSKIKHSRKKHQRNNIICFFSVNQSERI